MKELKRNKGITLVALIITIIVLLILAVVAIGSITNEGIINHAKNARTEYEAAQANEQRLLDEYEGYLENINTPAGVDDSTFAKITADNYGDSFKYTDLNGDNNLTNDWKVFYKDNNYLFIIASDYLKNTNLPFGLKMTTYGTYGAYWTDEIFTSADSSAIKKAVANKYKLSWLPETATSNANARATADLLNVDAWTEKFGDSSKGIEAIGGPTLEMWVASWNASGYTPLYTAYNATGYYIGTTENPTTNSISLSSDTAGYADIMYFPYTIDIEECYGYWLASPRVSNPSNSKFMMILNSADGLAYTNYNDGGYAVRPLVSLPSTLVSANADGSFAVAQ